MGNFLSKIIDPDYINREDNLQEFESSLNDIKTSVNIEKIVHKDTLKTLENSVTIEEITTLFELFFGIDSTYTIPIYKED